MLPKCQLARLADIRRSPSPPPSAIPSWPDDIVITEKAFSAFLLTPDLESIFKKFKWRQNNVANLQDSLLITPSLPLPLVRFRHDQVTL